MFTGGIKIEGLEEVISEFDRMPEELQITLRKSIQKNTNEIKTKLQKRVNNGANNSLHSRTGQLAKSFRYIITKKGLQSRIFTLSPYAPIHEFGGIIRGKNKFTYLTGKALLAIPSDENKTGAGVMKKTVKEVFSGGGYTMKISSAKKAKGLVLYKSKPYFWLVPWVKIEARLKMYETVEDQVPSILSDISKLIDKIEE